MIQYLSREQIDDERWNSVIESAVQERIYPYTWYLDLFGEHWGAFVMGDYEYVLPLIFRKKFGFKYLFSPSFCQQLGIFSAKAVEKEVASLFLKKIRKEFKFGDYPFNASNLLDDGVAGKLSENKNFVLDLSFSYDLLLKNYSQNCKRNVKKAHKEDLTIDRDRDRDRDIEIEEIINLKKDTVAIQQSDDHYSRLGTFFRKLQELGKLEVIAVWKDNELCAAAIFGKSKKRYYYLLSASDGVGKDSSAMFFIVDTFLKRHAEEGMVLDFEGSNIPSIARFFTGFGAKSEIYQRLHLGTVSRWIIKKLKK